MITGAALAGLGIAPRTRITAQLDGTPGGAGSYMLNVAHNRSGAPFTASYARLTISSIVAGTVEIGHAVHGGAIGTVVRVNVGVDDYLVTPSQTVPAGTPLGSSFLVSSKWTALSGGAPGELVRISGWPLG